MSSNDDNIKYFGFYTMPYAGAWPELKTQLYKIYKDRLFPLPWLPADFRLQLLGSMTNNNIVMIAPSTASYPGGQGAQFLDTPEKKAWWDQLASITTKAVKEYAAGKTNEGRVTLAHAYATSDLMSNLVSWATIIAAPAHAARAAWNNPYTTTATAIAVGIGLLAIYHVITRGK